MTLCIAAISSRDGSSNIVAVTDLLLSSDTDSFDTRTLKCETVSPSNRWIAMYAGLPSSCYAVCVHAEDVIAQGAETFSEVQAAFEDAFRRELKRKIEGELLSRYGLDREAFLRGGRAHFGDEEFLRLLYQLNGLGLETEFIVAGFGADARPQIFSVEDPGICTRHSSLGFHAIGAGSVLANSALCGSYDSELAVTDMIYRLCEAKFLAEAAPSVGRKTVVHVVAPDGAHQIIRPSRVGAIRGIWEQAGRPPVPESAHQTIAESLDAFAWVPRQEKGGE